MASIVRNGGWVSAGHLKFRLFLILFRTINRRLYPRGSKPQGLADPFRPIIHSRRISQFPAMKPGNSGPSWV